MVISVIAFTIRVVSNLPRVSIVMPCDYRVWAPFWAHPRCKNLSPATSDVEQRKQRSQNKR